MRDCRSVETDRKLKKMFKKAHKKKTNEVLKIVNTQTRDKVGSTPAACKKKTPVYVYIICKHMGQTGDAENLRCT